VLSFRLLFFFCHKSYLFLPSRRWIAMTLQELQKGLFRNLFPFRHVSKLPPFRPPAMLTSLDLRCAGMPSFRFTTPPNKTPSELFPPRGFWIAFHFLLRSFAPPARVSKSIFSQSFLGNLLSLRPHLSLFSFSLSLCDSVPLPTAGVSEVLAENFLALRARHSPLFGLTSSARLVFFLDG